MTTQPKIVLAIDPKGVHQASISHLAEKKISHLPE